MFGAGSRAGDDAMIDTLDALGLGSWVRSLPAGLDTPLGVAGVGVSAGEGQLLAFARVFLADPGLVILDEASSRLDPATEALVEAATRRLLEGRTAVVIAHRLSSRTAAAPRRRPRLQVRAARPPRREQYPVTSGAWAAGLGLARFSWPRYPAGGFLWVLVRALPVLVGLALKAVFDRVEDGSTAGDGALALVGASSPWSSCAPSSSGSPRGRGRSGGTPA